MYVNRICPMCKMDRIPSSEVVKEGKQRYVIYTCRICKHRDIERWADRPRPKLWSGKEWLDPDGTDDSDGSYFKEG